MPSISPPQYDEISSTKYERVAITGSPPVLFGDEHVNPINLELTTPSAYSGQPLITDQCSVQNNNADASSQGRYGKADRGPRCLRHVHWLPPTVVIKTKSPRLTCPSRVSSAFFLVRSGNTLSWLEADDINI